MADIIKIKGDGVVPAVDIALDTILKGKQALIFCNSKRGAESAAEKISKAIKNSDDNLKALSEKALKVLSSPTRQCKRLSGLLKKGVAFHHAGLPYGQRVLIEDSFKEGTIKIICCTPTLAIGINLPAYRAVLKDLKRYGGRWGMQWIPVLEYHQCAGRAGRPDFNDMFGEAICIAQSDAEKDEIRNRFIDGVPEKIFSKLAVEPVMRSYILSLVAMSYVDTKKKLLHFFEKTFYGYQFKDFGKLELIITKMIDLLSGWGFLEVSATGTDFVSADSLHETKLVATRIGKRVAQLYIDPLTADFIINSIKRGKDKQIDEFSMIHMISNTLELRPYFRVGTKDFEEVQDILMQNTLMILEPSIYEPEFDIYMDASKTAMVLYGWMEEKAEDYLLEKYRVRPGELNAKKERADWMLFASEELARQIGVNEIISLIRKTRYRLKKGIKEELIPLARIKGIGRVRARKLFRNGIKDIGDIKKVDITKLVQLVGRATAISLKKEAGIDLDKEKVPKRKRKGQLSLEKF